MSFKKYNFLFLNYAITTSLYAVECKSFDALTSSSGPHTPQTYAHKAHTPPKEFLYKGENTEAILQSVAKKLILYQKGQLTISCQ